MIYPWYVYRAYFGVVLFRLRLLLGLVDK